MGVRVGDSNVAARSCRRQGSLTFSVLYQSPPVVVHRGSFFDSFPGKGMVSFCRVSPHFEIVIAPLPGGPLKKAGFFVIFSLDGTIP